MPMQKRIVQALRQLTQFLDTHSRKLLKAHAITIPQVLCLEQLVEKGTMTVAVLASSLCLSASTTVGIIDRLEKKKFVRRRRDSKDRRSVFVDITDKGKEFLAMTPDLMHHRLYDILRKMPEGERHETANALDRLVHALKEENLV